MSQDNMMQYQLSFNTSEATSYNQDTGEYEFQCDDNNRLMRISLGTLELQPTQTTVSEGHSDLAFSEGIKLQGPDAVLTLKRSGASRGATQKKKLFLPPALNAIAAVEIVRGRGGSGQDGPVGLVVTTEQPHGLLPGVSFNLPGIGIVCTPTGLNLQAATIASDSSKVFTATWDPEQLDDTVREAIARQAGVGRRGTVSTSRWPSVAFIAGALKEVVAHTPGVEATVEARDHSIRVSDSPWSVVREGMGSLLGEGEAFDPGTHVASIVPANYNYNTFSGMMSQCMSGFTFDKDALMLYIGDSEGTAKVQLPLISTTGYTLPLLQESINAVLGDVGLPFSIVVSVGSQGRMTLASDNGRCFSLHFDAPKSIISRLLGFDPIVYAGASSYTSPQPCTLVTAGVRCPNLKYEVTPSATGVLTVVARPQRALLQGNQITSMGLLGVQKNDLVYLSNRGYHHVSNVEFSMRKTTTEQSGELYIPQMRLQFSGMDSRTTYDGLAVCGVDCAFSMRTDTGHANKMSPAVYGFADGRVYASSAEVSRRPVTPPPGDAVVRAPMPAQLDHVPYVFMTLSSGTLNHTAHNRALTRNGWKSVFAKVEMAGYRIERENAMVTMCPEGDSLGRFRIGIRNPDFTPYRSMQPFSFTLSCTGRVV